MTVITLTQFKGGVGKTTSEVGLSTLLCERSSIGEGEEARTAEDGASMTVD